MQLPNDHDGDLHQLFTQLREAPPAADIDPTRVAPGFEARVLARMRETAAPDALRWFWRWSAVFGAAAAICIVLVIQNYNALNDESLAALEGGSSLLGWFF
jgi:hypothetical protein